MPGEVLLEVFLKYSDRWARYFGSRLITDDLKPAVNISGTIEIRPYMQKFYQEGMFHRCSYL